ncbi:uncharacterized protein V1513DRAFT_185312 [Lipomyces chichibuensis]|uniref:uncharacterized protein n=1 Tax=Lipomyces chichibuensis TaxID=1546026 RepID=UPI0033437626
MPGTQLYSAGPSRASSRMTKSQLLRMTTQEQLQQTEQSSKDDTILHVKSSATRAGKYRRKLSQRQRKSITAAEKERINTEIYEQHTLQEEESKIMPWAKADTSIPEPDTSIAITLSAEDQKSTLSNKSRAKAIVPHTCRLQEEQRVHVDTTERHRWNHNSEPWPGRYIDLRKSRDSGNLCLQRSELDQSSTESNIATDLSQLSLWDAPVLPSNNIASSVMCSRSSAVSKCLHIMELLDIISEYVYDNGSSRAAFASSRNFMLVCKRFMFVMFCKLASIRFFDTFYSVSRERFDDMYAYSLRHLRFRDSYLTKYDDEANSTKYIDQNMIIYSRYGLIRFRRASFPKLKTLEICEAGSLGLVLAAPLAPALEQFITRSPVLLSDGCIMQIGEFYNRLRRIEIANPGIPLQSHEMNLNTGFTDKAFLHLLSRIRFTLEELVLYYPKAADAKQRVLERRIVAPRLYQLSLAVLSSMPRLKVLETFAISEKRYIRDYNHFREGRPVFNETFNMALTLGLPESVAKEDHSGAVYAHRFHSRPSDEWRAGASMSTVASPMSLLSTPGEIIASRRTSSWSSSTPSSPSSSSVSTFSNDPIESEPESNQTFGSVDSAIAAPVNGFCPFEEVVHRKQFFSSLQSLKMVSHTAEFVLAFLCMFPGGREGLVDDDIRVSNSVNEEDEEKTGTALRHLEISFIIGSELERFLIRASGLSWNDVDVLQWERMHVFRGLECLKLNVIGECALKTNGLPQIFVARESVAMFEMAFPHITLLLTSRVKIIDESRDNDD